MSSRESEFLMSMEDMEQYKGKWIAILDDKVIAADEILSKAYSEAIQNSKGRTPLFEYIPKKLDEQTIIL